mmetsp:Transcript_17662/g.28675  ORF Transcript_17662/g.28675 Transcript_17662/m.28675 type:complete len:204 (+) Transcript_17662:155-766(+)
MVVMSLNFPSPFPIPNILERQNRTTTKIKQHRSIKIRVVETTLASWQQSPKPCIDPPSDPPPSIVPSPNKFPRPAHPTWKDLQSSSPHAEQCPFVLETFLGKWVQMPRVDGMSRLICWDCSSLQDYCWSCHYCLCWLLHSLFVYVPSSPPAQSSSSPPLSTPQSRHRQSHRPPLVDSTDAPAYVSKIHARNLHPMNHRRHSRQ